MWHAKRLGFSDEQIGRFIGSTEMEWRAPYRRCHHPTYKAVDTCAASSRPTPYFYSTYEQENEAFRYPVRNR